MGGSSFVGNVLASEYRLQIICANKKEGGGMGGSSGVGCAIFSPYLFGFGFFYFWFFFLFFFFFTFELVGCCRRGYEQEGKKKRDRFFWLLLLLLLLLFLLLLL